MVTSGAASDPTRVQVLECPAGRIASSYQAELCAMLSALGWLRMHEGEWRSVAVVTDSQSVLVALRGCRGMLCEGMLAKCAWFLTELCERGKRVAFVWVPGHCMIMGNEWADAAAGRGARLGQDGCVCLRSSVRFWLRGRMRRHVWVHERCERVYGTGVKHREEREWSRSEVVSMGRFRSGHSLELGAYRVRIGLAERGACRLCGEPEEECLEHVWTCPLGLMKRRVLGLSDCLSEVCLRPGPAIQYWRWWRDVHPRWA